MEIDLNHNKFELNNGNIRVNWMKSKWLFDHIDSNHIKNKTFREQEWFELNDSIRVIDLNQGVRNR